MKVKRLTTLLLLLCLVFCACQSGPTPDTTEAPSQTEQTIHAETTSPPEIPPSDENTISCLYEFFMDDANLNRIPENSSDGGNSGWDDPPHTDRSRLYGTTYRFRLTTDWSWHQFCFRYDVIEKQLAVVLTETRFSDTEVGYPILLIFQVHNARDWDDIVRIVEEDQYISATLLHARNIDIARTQAIERAFYPLREIPFEADSLTPFRQYILGYAVYDDVTYLIAASEHDAIEQIDYIISVYGEDPS